MHWIFGGLGSYVRTHVWILVVCAPTLTYKTVEIFVDFWFDFGMVFQVWLSGFVL